MTADEYDDGRTDVPGGVSAPVERVVVVGAGIAGLTAANALRNAGIEYVVVEARERIGGRLHTIDLSGVPVDLGGSWIHHPIGNPLRRFAQQHELACDAGDPLPQISAYDGFEQRALTSAELAESLSLQMDDFPAAIDDLRARLPVTATAAEAIESYVEAAGLAAGPARRARQGLRAIIEADAADTADRQSLQWIWNEMEYEGDLFGDLPRGGYATIAKAMAAGLDVRLGQAVVEVEQVDDGVVVRCADGTVEHGSHVVVAVPLGVLKRGSIRFSPPLPAERTDAIARLGFGRYEKVALRFEEPFWSAAGLSHLMYFPAQPDHPAVWIFDLDAFDAGPVLAAHVFDSNTHRVLGVSEDEAVRWVTDMIADVTGAPCPEPVAVTVTAWANDPFTGGAYTHVPPGASPDDLDLLGEPVGGRILFAGEHSQSMRTGYADGAMSSGIREAKRLLQRSTVRL